MDETIPLIRRGCNLARELESNLPNLTKNPDMLLNYCDEVMKIFGSARERLCVCTQDPSTSHPHIIFREPQRPPQIDATDLQGWLTCTTQATDIIQPERDAVSGAGGVVNVVAGLGGRDAEGSARLRITGGEVQGMDLSVSGMGSSSSQRLRRRKDDGERRTVMLPAPRMGNTDSPPDDIFTWRKYGQKEILGSRFPRSYYRCTHQKLYNCPAKRQVQRLDDDPYMFEVTYRGHHTCHMSSTAPSIPAPHEMTQVAPTTASSIPWLSMVNLGGAGSSTTGIGGGGAGPSTTARSGKDVDQFPVADMADVMFNSGSSSSNSMDFLFHSAEDKREPRDKQN